MRRWWPLSSLVLLVALLPGCGDSTSDSFDKCLDFVGTNEILTCADQECPFGARVDCETACENRRTVCGAGCPSLGCTRFEIFEVCVAGCERSVCLASGNVEFGCQAAFRTCASIVDCLSRNR
ncbi:MAG: hypothetical protein WBG86_11735 [Polyangiales bacterium]